MLVLFVYFCLQMFYLSLHDYKSYIRLINLNDCFRRSPDQASVPEEYGQTIDENIQDKTLTLYDSVWKNTSECVSKRHLDSQEIFTT